MLSPWSFLSHLVAPISNQVLASIIPAIGDSAIQDERARTEYEEIALLVELGHKYLWKGSRVKAMIESNGIHVVRGDYYSPVPTISEIESSWELNDGALP